MNKLIWTEPKSPTKNESHYDHIFCHTPLGKMIIEWKSWKEYPSYDVTILDKYIGETYNLDEAKSLAENYLININNELTQFLSQKIDVTKVIIRNPIMIKQLF